MSFMPFWGERNFVEFIQLLEVSEPDRGEFLLFHFDPEFDEVVCEFDIEATCKPDGFFVEKSREFRMTLKNYSRLVEAVAKKKEIFLRNRDSELRGGVKEGQYRFEFSNY